MAAGIQNMLCGCGNTILFPAVDQPTALICPRCQDTVVSSTVPDPNCIDGAFRPSSSLDAQRGARSKWKVGDIVCENIEFMECLGQGGMGSVFRVHNHAWNVDLAAKIPSERMLRWAGGVEYVERECNTWIDLGLHAHVVTCFYVKRIDNVPIIFTDYVAGGDLSRWIRDGRMYRGDERDALARILSTVIQAAWGLHFAHAAGIVHLDLKPSNILMTEGETAKLTDFGLANRIRAVEANEDPSMDASSNGMTPAYCAPEQLTQQSVQFSTDIWALGVTLLELFTGRVEWKVGPEAPEYLDALLAKQRIAPHSRAIPGPVASVMRACLRRNPEARVEDASTLASALIDAYEQCLGARYPVPPPQNIPARIENSNNKAVSLLDLGKHSEAVHEWRNSLSIQPGSFEATFNLALEEWRCAQITDEEVLRRIEHLPAATDLADEVIEALVDIHIERGDIARAGALKHGAPFETADRVERVIAQSAGTARTHLGGQRTHQDVVTGLAIGGNERLVYSASRDNSILCWDVMRQTCTGVFEGHRHAVLNVIAPSEDDDVCLSFDERGVVHVWRARDAVGIATFSGPWERVFAVALAPQYRSLIVLAERNQTYAVDMDTHDARPLAQGPAGIVHRGMLSNDGRIAVSVLNGSTLAVWNAQKGTSLRNVGAGDAEVSSVAISQDGLLVAWGDHAGVLRTVDLANTAKPREFLGHRGSIEGLAILDDGRNVLSAGADHTLRLWDTQSRRCLVSMGIQGKPFRSVAATRGGHVAITGSDDGSIDFWRLSTEITFRAAPFRLSRIVDTELSQAIELEFKSRLTDSIRAKRDGEMGQALAAALAARSIRGCDRRPELMHQWFDLYGQTNLIELNDMWGLNAVSVSDSSITAIAHIPNSAGFLLGMADGGVQLFDQRTEALTRAPAVHGSGVRLAAVSHDGGHAATFGDFGEVFLWAANPFEKAGQFTLASSDVSAVDWSPDSRFLALADWQIDVVNLATGQSIAKYGTFGDQVRALKWMPDVDTILVAAGEHLYSCELLAGTVSPVLDFRPYQIAAVAVSLDGRYVLGAGETMTSRRGGFFVWDTRSRAIVMRNESLSHSVHGLSFLSDGRHFLLGTDDGVIRLWHVESERPLRTLSEFSGHLTALFTSWDNRYAAALNQEGIAKIWALDWQLSLEPPPDAVERLTSIVDCDKRARNATRRLEQRWRKFGLPTGEWATPASLQTRIAYGGLGGLSQPERRRMTQSPRWWYKK